MLTCCEHVIPPVRLANVGLEVVGSSGHNHLRRSDHGADGQEHGKDGHNDAEPLDEVQVGNFDRLGGADAKNDGNPATGEENERHIKRQVNGANGKRAHKHNGAARDDSGRGRGREREW